MIFSNRYFCMIGAVVLFSQALEAMEMNKNKELPKGAQEGKAELITQEIVSAAEKGDAECAYLLGLYHDGRLGARAKLDGVSLERDPEQAMKWYEKAARNGKAEAHYRLFQILQKKKRDDEARTHLQYAEELGCPQAQFDRAMLWYEEPDKAGKKKAVRLFERLLKNTCTIQQAFIDSELAGAILKVQSDAAYFIGCYYEEAAAFKKAASFYEASLELKSNVKSSLALARLLIKGALVVNEANEIEKYLMPAVDAQYPEALRLLAQYKEAQGNELTPEVINLYKRAAHDYDVPAIKRIEELCRAGKIKEPLYEQIIKLLEEKKNSGWAVQLLEEIRNKK